MHSDLNPTQRLQWVIGKLILSLNYGFWGNVASLVHWEPNTNIPTAGLLFQSNTNAVVSHYNPDWVTTLTDAELAFVIIHEMKHLIYMHPWQFTTRHKQRMNIACDRYVNSEIQHDLASNDRYVSVPQIEGMAFLKPSQQLHTRTTLQIYEEEESPPGGSGQKGMVDSHDHWESIVRNIGEEDGKALVKGILENAQTMGTMPQSISELIRILSLPKMTWQRKLRNWIGGATNRTFDLSWKKPNRSDIQTLPGRQQVLQTQLGIVVDVSGSISNEVLGRFVGEMAVLSKQYSILQMEVDATIQSPPQRFVASTVMRQGYRRYGAGGTDMNPGITAMMLDRNVDMVIVLTDGAIPPITLSNVRKPLLFVISPTGRLLDIHSKYVQLKLSE